MCWTSLTKPKLQTARKDIVVYKAVFVREKRIESYYQKFHYELGRKYEIPKLELLLTNPTPLFPKCYTVFEGFHSYNDCPFERHPGLFPHIKIVECTIPKGSKYYRNEQETVSNAIIINKIKL